MKSYLEILREAKKKGLIVRVTFKEPRPSFLGSNNVVGKVTALVSKKCFKIFSVENGEKEYNRYQIEKIVVVSAYELLAIAYELNWKLELTKAKVREFARSI